MRKFVLAVLLLCLQPAWAETDQVQAISEKLRCLVCQNQTIAESDAPLAQDLRRQVREQLAKGKSEGEILSYMVARYGDFVLYQPPFKPATWLLWLGPLLLLGVGVAVLYSVVQGQAGLAEEGTG
ncbi:MAG TPA: cytochrome c-type biogenesis protein [Telluria sp.]